MTPPDAFEARLKETVNKRAIKYKGMKAVHAIIWFEAGARWARGDALEENQELNKERDELKALLADINSRVVPGSMDSIDSLRAMYRERDELKAELAEAREAIESISSKNKPRHSEAKYWEKACTHGQCAEVLANDTRLARDFLSKYPAKPALPPISPAIEEEW